MRIALAQLNYHIGNFRKNVLLIRQALEKGRKHKADLVVFSELAVCGYPPRDFLSYPGFAEECRIAVEEIAKECTDIAAIVGSPWKNPLSSGKRLHNSAVFLSGGKVKKVVHKTLLPTYDVFDEYRYFEPNKTFGLITCKGVRIALTICEDIWTTGSKPMYVTDPMKELSRHKPDIAINIAASPFSVTQEADRRKVVSALIKKYHLPLAYVNHTGAQTELIFDGGSGITGISGRDAGRLSSFSEDFGVYEFEPRTKSLQCVFRERGEQKYDSGTAKIYEALVTGVRDYFHKQGFKKAVLGLSGGIDSAVVAVLACSALGKENVKVFLMPSGFSSAHSVNDAEQLAEKTGIAYEVISIESLFQSFGHVLKKDFRDCPFDVTEENIQARIRAVLLMAHCNKFGYILLNTSNKSEIAVGYGTLYGDMCGGLSVLGDIYKTGVYELAAFINREEEIIPVNIIRKDPSAELRPGQKDSDSLPAYAVLDKVLFHYIELSMSPDEIIRKGFKKPLVERILKMVNSSEYKRCQAPPILRVSPKAFGVGRRMPIVAKYL